MMKILILGYIDFPSWKEALISGARKLGHNVVVCGPDDPNSSSFYIVNGFRPDVSLGHDKYVWHWEEIVRKLRESGIEIKDFDLILLYETNLNIYGGRPNEMKDIPVVYLITDSHRGCDTHIRNFRDMNADYLGYSKVYFRQIYRDWIGIANTFFVPECTNIDLFKPLDGVNEIYDLVWTGWSGMNPDGSIQDPKYSENAWRATYLKWLINNSGRMGIKFGNFGFIQKREDYIKTLNFGKIIFNCGGGSHPLQAQSSNRIFEAMACGKLVLTAYFTDLALLFEEGKEIIAFRSYHHWNHPLTLLFDCKEIENLVKYYLNHEDERKQIGNNARKCIVENYSGECNIKRIKDFLNL